MDLKLILLVGILVTGSWALSMKVANDAGKTSVENEWNKDIIVRTNKLLRKEAEHRATEKKWAESFRLNVDWYLSEKGRIQNDYETTIAGINNGTLVLRDRFRGCQRKLSQAGTASERIDGGSERGLSAGDQRFLVRIGERCNMVAARLTSLQKHIRSQE